MHRVRTSTAEIEKLVEDAIALTKALSDVDRTIQMEMIQRELKLCLKEMERKQILSERKLSLKLKTLAEGRLALERLEKQAVRNVFEDDEENDGGLRLRDGYGDND